MCHPALIQELSASQTWWPVIEVLKPFMHVIGTYQVDKKII
jgi:hypothetical protein